MLAAPLLREQHQQHGATALQAQQAPGAGPASEGHFRVLGDVATFSFRFPKGAPALFSPPFLTSKCFACIPVRRLQMQRG